MTHWMFRRLETAHTSIDASAIRRRFLATASADQILCLPLRADGQNTELGELFTLACEEAPDDRIVVEGDLCDVHGLATAHDSGDFEVIGNVGHHVAAGMTGGNVRVRGSAGNFAGAAVAANKTGMAGGILEIDGNVGSHLAHRMRRGLVVVGGDAGEFTAASLVAGTVCIAGVVDASTLGVGMKRGTLMIIAADMEQLHEQARFSGPVQFSADFLRLYHTPAMAAFVRRFGAAPASRLRGDRNVGGIGELILPG